MKYKICENKSGKFKIQKREWFIFPMWQDVTIGVMKRYQFLHRASGSFYSGASTKVFNSVKEAEECIKKFKLKDERKKDYESMNNVWKCKGTY